MASSELASVPGPPGCVAVYSGASVGNKPEYTRDATELANCLTARNITIVNGGSSFGLLGVVGRRTLEKGGKLVGIIPEFFTKYPDYKPVGDEIVVADMHTRKKMMFDRSEAFIALPGGIGTMEELTEVLTWQKLSLHSKPVALLNTVGYYDSFLQWLSRAIEDGFISSPSVDKLLIVEADPQKLVERLCKHHQIS